MLTFRLAAWLLLAALCALSLWSQPASASPGTLLSSQGSPRVVRSISVPSSIDPTGQRDVTAELSRFVAKVPHGSRVLFPEDANYRLDGTIRIESRQDLELVGNTTVFTANGRGNRNRSQFDVVDSERIAFRGLSIRGANPRGGTERDAYVSELEAQHGFNLVGVRDLELDRVEVTDVYGDCVYVGRTASRESDGVWIHDSRCVRTGRHGVAVTAGKRVVIERNLISQTRWATVDLEPNGATWAVSDVFILENKVGPGRLLFVAAHGAGPVNQIVVADNVLAGRPLSISMLAPLGTRRRGVFVTGNSGIGIGARNAVFLTRVDGAVVEDNRQQLRSDKAGVLADDVCGLRVAGNLFGVRPLEVAVAASDCSEVVRLPSVAPAVPAVAGRGPIPKDNLPTLTNGGLPAGPPDDQPDVRRDSWPTSLLLLAVGSTALVVSRRWLVRQRRNTTQYRRHQ